MDTASLVTYGHIRRTSGGKRRSQASRAQTWLLWLGHGLLVGRAGGQAEPCWVLDWGMGVVLEVIRLPMSQLM